MYRKLIKRSLDLLFSIMALILLSPLMVLVFLILTIANHGAPLFRQNRPGRKGRVFTLYKFRTMNQRRDENGKLLPDEQRLTPMGRFVRKTSLDELPQLFNVLKGDMSLIGPRPLLVEYLPLYSERQARRHEVRPGITGWAQVNGRNAIDWEQKFELDIWYVDNISLKTDCRILWLTIKKVIQGDGISRQGHATMPFFKGAKGA